MDMMLSTGRIARFLRKPADQKIAALVATAKKSLGLKGGVETGRPCSDTTAPCGETMPRYVTEASTYLHFAHLVPFGV